MNFAPLDEKELDSKDLKTMVLLKARSLLILSGEARWDFSQIFNDPEKIFTALNIDMLELKPIG